MKSIYLIILTALFISVHAIGQEINENDKNFTSYTFDVNYVLPAKDSLKVDPQKQVKVLLNLDKKAFDKTANIIVEQKNLKEANHLTGRSVKVSLEDRLTGWEKVLKNKYDYKDDAEIAEKAKEIRANDKTRIMSDTYQVEIDLGTIRRNDTTQEVSVKLEYKDGSMSEPLKLHHEIISEE
jgi:hypothetical protein